ncbi:MAG: hypothetical protein PHP54_06170 [Clostridia bacterium]|nr:hypothetical protein [Clostridia bacterium]
MKKNKIICIILLVFVVFMISNTIFATSGDSNDFWKSATEWFKNIDPNKKLDSDGGVANVVQTFTNMISVVGNTVFVIVTIFLGIKYMYGSVEAKASVKESLISLLVACVFFFGWDALSNLLFPNNNFIFIQQGDTSYEQMVGRIFAFATYIAQFLAILGIIYVGVRYIFAGAEGKASLKGKSAVFLIGIILAFCSTSFLSLVSDIVNESINGTSATEKSNIVIQDTIIAKDEDILLSNNVFSI